jgi:hypothetical protein
MQNADALLDIYQTQAATMDQRYEWFTGEQDALKGCAA